MKIFAVKRKKASLDLSLNAIVILILAIAILGLGLAFIRGIFKNITVKVDEAVSAGEIQNPPTRDMPVTIVPSTVEMRLNEKAEIKVALLNVESTKKYFKLEIWPSSTDTPSGCSFNPATQPGCYCRSDKPCKVPMIYNPAKLGMEKDQINVWTVALRPKTTVEGTYLYTIQMRGFDTSTSTAITSTYTRDFIVVVKS